MGGNASSNDDDNHDTGPSFPMGPEITEDVLYVDYVFDALGHPRRRYICHTLHENTEWSLSNLATKIAAWERDISKEAVSDRHREKVYLSLYHQHIPKLVDADVITYNEFTETLHPAQNTKRVLRALASVDTSLDTVQDTIESGENHE